MLALTLLPDQRQVWWNDFAGTTQNAVEEIVRWASPVIYMRRTVTRDIELSGVKMAKGDKVSMWYASANRDEDKFGQPVALRTSPATPTTTSVSAAAAPTSASAPTWLPRDRGGVRGTAPAGSRHRGHRGAGDAVVGVHPRHQATPGGLDSAGMTRGGAPEATMRERLHWLSMHGVVRRRGGRHAAVTRRPG